MQKTRGWFMMEREVKIILTFMAIFLLILGGSIGYMLGETDANSKCQEACNEAMNQRNNITITLNDSLEYDFSKLLK